jgi:predicted nucleic acid-binding protein
MSSGGGILDSSVLIDCLRGRPHAVAFLTSLASQSPPVTHVMVAAELLAGARDKAEQQQIESFLKAFQIVSPNESDGLLALDLYSRFHLSNGVDWPDCQIAATALRLGLPVYTQNVKHFTAFTGLSVVRAY